MNPEPPIRSSMPSQPPRRRCVGAAWCAAFAAALALLTANAPAGTPAPGAPAPGTSGSAPASGTSRPKFGPAALRLHGDHEYLRSHEAPDFWALMPYYLPQQTTSSCSTAVVAMLINALRAGQALRADEKLATHELLLEKAGSESWKKAVATGGDGVSLDELGPLIEKSLAAYGLAGYTVEVTHANARGEQALAQLRRTLERNETSSSDVIIANFLQSAFTGDPDGAVGHYAPIGAYDREHQRVLILDPDREWYEPYWVSDQTLLDGLATQDGDAGRARGFLWIRRETD